MPVSVSKACFSLQRTGFLLLNQPLLLAIMRCVCTARLPGHLVRGDMNSKVQQNILLKA
jgi:hypothetical protein